MKRFSTLFLLTFFTVLQFSAQQNTINLSNFQRCGTAAPGEAWDQWFNKKVEEFRENQANGKVQTTAFTIPVIVHVIHGGQGVGAFPNISQAQINSQIGVLNNDYAGTGLNVANLAATAFSAVGAANTNVTFCMAEKDPSGMSLTEPGIERISYVSKGWSNPTSFTSPTTFQNYINGTVKPATIWDPSRYLNIWITDINANAGLLGFATFPPGSGLTGIPGSMGTSSTDGVWVWSRTYGNVGTLYSPYHKGRTATHEIGHWLGLRHINGDQSCGTDYCNDTPVQSALNFGCPAYPHISCSNGPNGEMFMNFMDYCDDLCLYMFSPDQSTRIQTAMANSPYRNQLTASAATLCNVPAVAPVAMYTVNSTNCRDSVVKPQNQTTGSPAPGYTWVASPSAGVVFSPNANAANPSIVFAYPAIYTLSLTATNSTGTSTYFDYIMILDCGDAVGMTEYNNLSTQVQLAPNPSQGNLQFKCSLSVSREVKVHVYNTLGQVVERFDFGQTKSIDQTLHLEHLPAGVYELNVDCGGEQLNRRIILNK
ncbi:MAG TPA: M43 family zinc metalloprotease [Bacteroidia bacterium]|nr:M43 family zinc metalloprotease [Bacteroidia bacterium]